MDWLCDNKVQYGNIVPSKIQSQKVSMIAKEEIKRQKSWKDSFVEKVKDYAAQIFLCMEVEDHDDDCNDEQYTRSPRKNKNNISRNVRSRGSE